MINHDISRDIVIPPDPDRPRDRAIVWRSDAFRDLEIMRATFVTHAFGRHTHDEYAIGLIERGTQIFAYRGQDRASSAGEVVVLQPGEVHTGHAATRSGYTYRMFYPPPVWMERAAEELTGRRGGLPFFPEPIIQDVELASRILTFHHALEDPTARLTRDALMLSVLTRFVARHSAPHSEPKQPSREPAAVRTARTYLEEHSDEDVSLDDLAAMAGLSPFHLVRTFRAATGLPPHAWLDQLRVRHARRLLREGMPIAQVAATAGFADQSHLTRRFKRLVGVTPGQYAAGSKIVQDSAP